MDLFRGLAILAVVLSHLPAPLPFHELVRNGTVYFVFISGFFFAHLYSDDQTVPTFWRKKAKRIILPYLISTIPGILMAGLIGGFDLYFMLMTIVTGTGHGNEPHWFIPFIVLIFVLFPLLRVLQNHGRILLWTTVVSLLVGMFTFHSDKNANPLLNLLHFWGVFPAGMLWHRHRAQLDAWGATHGGKIVICSLLAFLWLLALSILIPPLKMEDVLTGRIIALNYNFLGKLMIIPGVLVVLKKMTDNGGKCAPLKLLSATSFGLFFWHGYVIGLIFHSRLLASPTDTAQVMLFVLLKLIIVLGVVLLFLQVARKLIGAKSVMITGY